jgi:hypothetical protein
MEAPREEMKSVCFTRWPNARVVVIKCDTFPNRLFIRAYLVFGLVMDFLGILARPFLLLLYTGSRPSVLEHRAWATETKGSLVQKKDLYITIVAFAAVSLFCWFSVVVQSSGCWQTLHCIFALHCTLISIRSSHTNQHYHHLFLHEPRTGCLWLASRPKVTGNLYLRGPFCTLHKLSLLLRWGFCESFLVRCFGLKASHLFGTRVAHEANLLFLLISFFSFFSLARWKANFVFFFSYSFRRRRLRG